MTNRVIRLPRWRKEDEHLSRHDESLRIMPDEDFETVQRLMKGRSQPRGAAKAVNGVRPFSGLIYCETCQSVCYSRKSKNDKGEYHYYNCGKRQRNGPSACCNAASIREDRLVRLVTGICGEILNNGDDLIEDAIRMGTKAMINQREEARRLGRQIEELDTESTSLMKLMMNPAVTTGAVSAFSRQIATKEVERKKIESRLSRVATSASEGVERLAKSVRNAYWRACEDFAQIMDLSRLNRFVEEQIGPMVLTAEGLVVPRTLESTMASAGAEAIVNSSIAGGGFEPPTSGL
jgi:hypothetical protein